MGFVHLHGHSQYSLLEAIGSTKAIISKLKELGFSHAPIMDYNGLYNVITHFEVCKKEGVKPIIGVDLAVQATMQGKSMSKLRYITLIAKNYEGYMSLLDIVSRAHTSNKNGESFLGVSYFPDTRGNILCLINAYESPFADMIQAGRTHDDIAQTIISYEEVFGKGNIFLEVIPQSPKNNPELAKANNILWQLHEKTGLPILCSSNFHYIHKEDKEAFEIALCIKDGKRVYDDDRRKIQGDFYITSEEDIREVCEKNGFTPSQTDEMIITTEKAADIINLQIPLGKILFPEYVSPSEIVELYEKFKNM